MNKQKISELAEAIKTHLIDLAVNDKLPLDMTTLDTEPIEALITQAQPTQMEKAIANASHYLCDDEVSIEEQINAIANHDEVSDYIDDVEGVTVWERVTQTFDCYEFLNLIGL